jgi:hypothetical protein
LCSHGIEALDPSITRLERSGSEARGAEEEAGTTMAYLGILPAEPLRVVASLALCLGVLTGCGSDDGAPSNPGGETPEAPELESPAEGEFAIETSGGIVVDAGSATLKFVETSANASLEIMGTSPDTGAMLLLRLAFPRDGEVFGPHTTALAMPNEGESVAHVLFGGQADFQYSLAGEVDLTLSRDDHKLRGTFSIDVSAANELDDGTFEAIGDVRPLTGSFIGTYEYECYSTIPGHSMATRPDSEFCQALGL